MISTLLLVTGAAVLTGSATGTAILRARAQAWRLMDVPNARSLHSRATPRGGGVVIVLCVLAGVGVLTLAGALPVLGAGAFATGAALVATVGWIDDRRSLSPASRLAIHTLAAGALVWGWGRFEHLPGPGGEAWTLPAPVALAVTIFWLVGLLNAYNFMDGIDGLASGQAIVAGLMWTAIAGAAAPLPAAIALLIAGASLGFLWHNWSPARIFLGDAGSGFLGYAFGALPLMGYQATGDARLPIAGLLVMAPFVFDTSFTLLRRLARGENVVEPHRSHLYQQLVISGWSHATTAILYLALAMASGLAAGAWINGSAGWVLIPPIVAILLLPLLVARVASADKQHDG